MALNLLNMLRLFTDNFVQFFACDTRLGLGQGGKFLHTLFVLTQGLGCCGDVGLY